jgi:O-antigen/teichoic acid export membrane protein
MRKVFDVIAENASATTFEKTNPFGQVEDLKRNLVGKSIRGGVSLVLSEIGCNVFRLVGTVVMARLLTPEHFGLVGMVTAITAMAEMFKDLGLGTATIQQKEISHRQISTLFWINTGVGAVIMLSLLAASPFISWFYGDTRLLWISIAISSTFLFGGLTVQHQALLRRQMHFSKLAVIQVLATGLSTTIGIALAWQGFEYWALVWKEVSRAIFQVSGTWALSLWVPGLPHRGSGVRKMFHTGSHVTGFNILSFASRSLDQVLLGKFWGPGPVGLYKQAGFLLLLPTSLFTFPITYMMTPALSALQNEPERYSRYYKQVVSLLAFGYLPAAAYLGVYAETIVTFVLSEKWIACVPIMQILVFAACLETVGSTTGIVMITFGRTKDYLVLGAAYAVGLGLAVCIGVGWGLIGVATAYVAYVYLSFVPVLSYSFKDTPISTRLFFEAVSWPVVCTIIMTILLILIHHYFEFVNPLVEIGFSLVMAGIFYCGAWMFVPRGKQTLSEYFSYFLRALGTLPSLARSH